MWVLTDFFDYLVGFFETSACNLSQQQVLEEIGFPSAQAAEALLATRHNLAHAACVLCDADLLAKAAARVPGRERLAAWARNDPAAAAKSVDTFASMGFSREAAAEALAICHGRLEPAAELLLDLSNWDQDRGAGDQVLSSLRGRVDGNAHSALRALAARFCLPPPVVSECAICFEEIYPVEAVMRCQSLAGHPGHFFHAPCLAAWMQERPMATCPTCRRSLAVLPALAPALPALRGAFWGVSCGRHCCRRALVGASAARPDGS